MTPSMKRLPIFRAGICIAFFATGFIAPRVHAEDYAKSFSVSNRANVHVETNDGSVTVVAGDVNQVEFRVEYQGYELDKNLHIEAHQQGDDIELSARVGNRWQLVLVNIRKVHIEVRMPKDADLRVETGDGSIKASGLSGNVDLHTGDGSLKVDSLAGNLRLRTGDGSIEASDLDGRCEAVSGDGHIRLSGRFDALLAKSGDGSLNVSALHGSKLESAWSIRSGDGAIDVALPSDLSADIDASTHDGHISSDIPITVAGIIGKSRVSHVHGKLNGGGRPFSIHTGDGSIRLKQV
jgi:DUF4097 and DUF4098 domain-containing protein YvlB